MRRLSRRWRAGSAAVEFGLIAPIFFVVMIGVTDWGLWLEQRMRLQAAARAGAQVALNSPENNAAVSSAVAAAASGLGGLSITPSGVFCECGGTQMTSCTDSCTGTIATFVRVSVARPYARLTPAVPTMVSASVTLQLN